RTLDLWPELGQKLIGDGKGRPFTRLPGNCVFKLDVTELTLAVPKLPPEWDGLTILVLSDLHFHGTPSRAYFERVFAELAIERTDLVCLVGDYVDTDTHHEWIAPLLSRLSATEAKLAILGNHDVHHEPDRVRAELTSAGYIVLGNGWRELTIRGVKCVAVGHEGPWFSPPPGLSSAPTDTFRLCLSHTPDNFYWAQKNGINLVFCGHVHGGAIRLPLIGSIFIPSIYGRRFDQGVFAQNDTVMAVSRGVSGKEPIRFRCNPQVLRVKLQFPSHANTSG
ncbi:MAG: metallophosphoesterase, partial [Planctomycetia bacterium]|nr:metallophosphoesterase [Planctomycetia bacterium]